MTTLLPWVLFGLSSYLLVGIILSYHTPLGKKYYSTRQISLTFLWIFPVVGVILYGILFFYSFVVVDVFLFDDNNGLQKLLNL